MGSFLGLPNYIVNRNPAAGLEPGQSDYKDLGYKYDVVELITEGVRQNFTQRDLFIHSQVIKLITQQIVEYENLFGVKKWSTVTEVIDNVLQRHLIAKAKMKIVDPPKPLISLYY